MNKARKKIWNRCEFCGRFIGLSDFINNVAKVVNITPLSDYSRVEDSVYHVKCEKKNKNKVKNE